MGGLLSEICAPCRVYSLCRGEVRVKFDQNIVVGGFDVVMVCRHVLKIRSAIVERVMVSMMTDLATWGPGNEAMHREIDVAAVFANRGFGVPGS